MLGPSKRVFERTRPLGLTDARKFFVGWQYPLCVLASLFETIPIWENKQKHRATSETDFKNVNGTWCTFLRVDTHLRGNLHQTHFETFKKSVWESMTLGFDWRKKFFVGWQCPLCVLASLFRTIPIWKNKQEHRATPETDFKNANVSWCTFLGFHKFTHLRSNLH